MSYRMKAAMIVFFYGIGCILLGMIIINIWQPSICNSWDDALHFNAEQRHRLIGAWNQRAVPPPSEMQ